MPSFSRQTSYLQDGSRGETLSNVPDTSSRLKRGRSGPTVNASWRLDPAGQLHFYQPKVCSSGIVTILLTVCNVGRLHIVVNTTGRFNSVFVFSINYPTTVGQPDVPEYELGWTLMRSRSSWQRNRADKMSDTGAAADSTVPTVWLVPSIYRPP